MTQLRELAMPFPKEYRGKDDRGNEAVDHTVVTQRLLQVLGPYDLELREVLRSEVPPMTVNKGKQNERTMPGGHFVTGVVMRLSLEVDGRRISIDEVGGCENAAMKDGDGERMKHAISDAIKRCAMRVGLGLHMWAQDHFFLYDKLSKPSEGGEVSAEARPSQPSNTQAGGEVSAEVSGAGTDNEGEEARLLSAQPNDGLGEVTVTPAPASGKKSGSADAGASPAEPQGAGESSSPNEEASPSAPAPSPIPPATDLVETYGKVKVLKAARRFAAANGIDEPGSWEEINEPLSIIVGKELAKAGV